MLELLLDAWRMAAYLTTLLVAPCLYKVKFFFEPLFTVVGDHEVGSSRCIHAFQVCLMPKQASIPPATVLTAG